MKRGEKQTLSTLFGVLSYLAGLIAYILVIVVLGNVLLDTVAPLMTPEVVIVPLDPTQGEIVSRDPNTVEMIFAYTIAAATVALVLYLFIAVPRFVTLRFSRFVQWLRKSLKLRSVAISIFVLKGALYIIPVVLLGVTHLLVSVYLTFALLVIGAAAALMAIAFAAIQLLIARMKKQPASTIF